MFVRIFYIIILLSSVYSDHHLPAELTKCKKDDSECIKKTVIQALAYFEKGNREFGIPAVEPFYVERMEIGADPSKTVRLNQRYEHVLIHGIKDSKLQSVKITDDGTKCTWDMVFESPRTVMEADYALTGQMLLFPINGQGKCNITLVQLSNNHKVDCEYYTKNGKTYMRWKNYRMNMRLQNCHFDFENLMPGNEQISNELKKTINDNSMEIFQETKGGFEKILSRLHENVANAIFSKIPEDELFLAD